MAKPRPLPCRRQKLRRYAILLAVALAVLFLLQDFPIPNAELALRAAQRKHFFGPGEVLTMVDYPRPPNTVRSMDDQFYLLRWGDWYAWCGVRHYGLFWQTGDLTAEENDPSLPLMPLYASEHGDPCLMAALSNDPDIAAVEVSFPSFNRGEGSHKYSLYTLRSVEQAEDCFILRCEDDFLFSPSLIRLRGYDAAGNLIYETPTPEEWDDYGLSGA